MEVIKVIVNEVPKGCHTCVFSSLIDCTLLGKNFEYSIMYDWKYRPDWCPLTTQDYITSLHELAESEE